MYIAHEMYVYINFVCTCVKTGTRILFVLPALCNYSLNGFLTAYMEINFRFLLFTSQIDFFTL